MTCLTISIVNHNSVLPLQACLNSVINNVAGIDHEIVVVDNLCEELAKPILEEKYPQVRFLTNERTLGFSANHNQVLATAKSDYCLVLNPDVTLEDGVLPFMLAFMEDHPQVALSSPKITYLGGEEKEPPKHVGDALRDTILFSTFMLPGGTQALEKLKNRSQKIKGWFFSWLPHFHMGKPPEFAKITSSLVTSGESEKLAYCQEAQAVYGTCMLFRTAAFQSVGLLDEGYFMYWEEIDWCVRARRDFWSICYLPNVNVNHDGGFSTRQDPLKYIGISILSGLRFYHKHGGFLPSFFLKTFISLVAIMNITRWSILSMLSKRQRERIEGWMEMNTKILGNVWDPETYQMVHW